MSAGEDRASLQTPDLSDGDYRRRWRLGVPANIRAMKTIGRQKKGEEVMFSYTPPTSLCLSKCRPEEPLKGITPSTGGESG